MAREIFLPGTDTTRGRMSKHFAMSVGTKATNHTTTGPGGQQIPPSRQCLTVALQACRVMEHTLLGETRHVYLVMLAVSSRSSLPMEVAV